MIHPAQFEPFKQAARHRVMRLAAENTWLRHGLMELQERIAAMDTQLSGLESRAKDLKQSLADASAKTEPKTRSKQ